MDQNLEETDNSELHNDIITVSQLQVALRTTARNLQSKLEKLTKSADTRTHDGLFAMLQETAILLLDYSELWTHVLASSQTVDSRGAAENLFYELLQREQAKSNIKLPAHANSTIKQNTPEFHTSSETYIVVTILLITADHQPLFDEIYSKSLLRDVLQEITMMRAPYLMVFELLWVPQETPESLTSEGMMVAYGDMVAIS